MTKQTKGCVRGLINRTSEVESLKSNTQIQLTTKEAAIAEAKLDPEFAGHAKIRELFGLSRTHTYRLSTEGLIRSVSLRERGKARGRRLYDVQSVRDYFAANMETEVAND
jgi:hypothetical protein